jgi:hypothetical protein
MAEVVLFHHAQGLTPGVVAFADELCRVLPAQKLAQTRPGAR